LQSSRSIDLVTLYWMTVLAFAMNGVLKEATEADPRVVQVAAELTMVCAVLLTSV